MDKMFMRIHSQKMSTGIRPIWEKGPREFTVHKNSLSTRILHPANFMKINKWVYLSTYLRPKSTYSMEVRLLHHKQFSPIISLVNGSKLLHLENREFIRQNDVVMISLLIFLADILWRRRENLRQNRIKRLTNLMFIHFTVGVLVLQEYWDSEKRAVQCT